MTLRLRLPRLRLESLLLTGAVLSVLLLFAFAGIWTHFLRSNDANWTYVAHTREVINKLNLLRIELLELQSTERGYLITGNQRLFDRNGNAREAVVRHRDELARMVADNPAQVERVARLEFLLEERLATGAGLLEMRDNLGMTATQPVIANGGDEEQSLRVVALLDQMLGEEQGLLERRRARLKASLGDISEAAIGSGAIIVMLILGLAWAMRKDLRHRAVLMEQLDEIAHHDMLTGLANRRHFTTVATTMLALARRNETMAAVLMLDLDGFKKVNDTLGHDAGDALLHEVGSRLLGLARGSDLVARFGGDEFAVLLPDVNSVEGMKVVAQKIVDGLGEPYRLGLSDPQSLVGASVGIAWYPEHGEDLDTLMHNADAALYGAKHAGKRQYAIYEKQHSGNPAARQSLDPESP